MEVSAATLPPSWPGRRSHPPAYNVDTLTAIDRIESLINLFMSDNKTLPLSSFLLSESSKPIQRFMATLSTRRDYEVEAGRDSWVEKAIAKHGLEAWLGRTMDVIDEDAIPFYPGFNCCTLRHIDTISAKNIHLPEAQTRIVNISASEAFAHVTSGHIATITPGASYFLTDRVRHSSTNFKRPFCIGAPLVNESGAASVVLRCGTPNTIPTTFA